MQFAKQEALLAKDPLALTAEGRAHRPGRLAYLISGNYSQDATLRNADVQKGRPSI